jgi:hypothetical protein
MSGLSLERSRISIGDRVLIAEGAYTGRYGTVRYFDSSIEVVTLVLDR